MQEQEVYFDDVKNEIDFAKTGIQSKAITENLKNKHTLILDDVEKKLDSTTDELFLNSKSSSASKKVIKRGEVYLCNLGCGVGSEMRKLRPCVVLSNNVNNFYSANVIIAPITHTGRNLHSVVEIEVKKDEAGKIVLDGYANISNVREVSKARLGKFISKLNNKELKNIMEGMYDMFGVIADIKELRYKVNKKEEQIQIFKKRLENKNTELKELYDLTKTNSTNELKELLHKLLKTAKTTIS